MSALLGFSLRARNEKTLNCTVHKAAPIAGFAMSIKS